MYILYLYNNPGGDWNPDVTGGASQIIPTYNNIGCVLPSNVPLQPEGPGAFLHPGLLFFNIRGSRDRP